jgi:hypothetical protein
MSGALPYICPRAHPAPRRIAGVNLKRKYFLCRNPDQSQNVSNFFAANRSPMLLLPRPSRDETSAATSRVQHGHKGINSKTTAPPPAAAGPEACHPANAAGQISDSIPPRRCYWRLRGPLPGTWRYLRLSDLPVCEQPCRGPARVSYGAPDYLISVDPPDKPDKALFLGEKGLNYSIFAATPCRVRFTRQDPTNPTGTHCRPRTKLLTSFLGCQAIRPPNHPHSPAEPAKLPHLAAVFQDKKGGLRA